MSWQTAAFNFCRHLVAVTLGSGLSHLTSAIRSGTIKMIRCTSLDVATSVNAGACRGSTVRPGALNGALHLSLTVSNDGATRYSLIDPLTGPVDLKCQRWLRRHQLAAL